MTKKALPEDPSEAKLVLSLARKGYYVVDGILYYEGADVPDQRCIVVPEHLKQEILDDHHDSPFAGHFAAKKMAQRISQYFFWRGFKVDVYIQEVCIVHTMCQCERTRTEREATVS